MKNFKWLGWAALVVSSAVQAASFDCAKARTNVEKMICADSELSKLDDELAAAYKTAVQDKASAETIRQAQQAWLKDRNGCEDADCVMLSYQRRSEEIAQGTTVGNRAQKKNNKNVVEQYQMIMSEEDSVCKPILAAYNRDTPINLLALSSPHAYPRPSPPKLALPWKAIRWEIQATENWRVGDGYSVVEADVNHDGQPETIVLWANWGRGDDRFTAIQLFPDKFLMPKRFKEFEEIQFQKSIAHITPGIYNLSKLNTKHSPTELNDFDVIQFNGKHYVTGVTAILRSNALNGIEEDQKVFRWRVISRIRFGNSSSRLDSELDWTLDSICYFLVK